MSIEKTHKLVLNLTQKESQAIGASLVFLLKNLKFQLNNPVLNDSEIEAKRLETASIIESVFEKFDDAHHRLKLCLDPNCLHDERHGKKTEKSKAKVK